MSFRLIVDSAADGATNMAVDEALLESATEGAPRLTLRLYRFASPTITFGFNQDVEDACDESECERLGITRVRRITGGRALIHQHELTYAVAAPPLARSVQQNYRLVSGAIREALQSLGVPLDRGLARPEARAEAHLPCLSVPTGHELAVGGRKLVASAMRFRRKGFLLHGSILWRLDRPLWRRATHVAEGADLAAVGLSELSVPDLSEARLVDALGLGFARLTGGPGAREGLSPAERIRASELRAKYASAQWTEERVFAPREPARRSVDNLEAAW